MNEPNQEPPPRYKWPWFLLGAVVLGAVLFVVWVTIAATRTREMRDPNPFATPVDSRPK
jgi:hypothetical protein